MKDLSKQIDLFVNMAKSLPCSPKQKELISKIMIEIVDELHWREKYINILKSRITGAKNYEDILEKTSLLCAALGITDTEIYSYNLDVIRFIVHNRTNLKREITSNDLRTFSALYYEYLCYFDEKPTTLTDLNKLKDLEDSILNTKK